jgi:hypothetical protein
MRISVFRFALIVSLLLCFPLMKAGAQNHVQKKVVAHKDTTIINDGGILTGDKVAMTPDDSLSLLHQSAKDKQPKRDWATWRPDPKRALWLAIVLPGAGQIYNRKYWKLPIVYGGFVGCIYAMRWNNQMYRDYSQAYMDMMDDDPHTQSYNQFLHLGNQITSANISTYQSLFKKRKDRYRRWRDLSFFSMVGVYALSIIDAYVDASLSNFDISKDLSMHIEPAVIGTDANRSPLKSSGVGLMCSFNF